MKSDRGNDDAVHDPRRGSWFMVPFVAGAMMLLAATAFAAGDDTPVQGPGANDSVAAGTTAEDCVATGGQTMDGMPSTQHQEQVLKGVDEADAEQLQAMEPAAGCPETGEMPATQHQQDVLEGEQAPDAAQ